ARAAVGPRLGRRVSLGQRGGDLVLGRPEGTDGRRLDDPGPAGPAPRRGPRPVPPTRPGGARRLSVSGDHRAVSVLYQALLTGLVLTLVTRRGEDTAADFVFRLFRRPHPH